MTPPGVGKRGGGVLLMMGYTGRLFQASGNSDIRGLLVEVYERLEYLSLRSVKGPKRANTGCAMHIYKTLHS